MPSPRAKTRPRKDLNGYLKLVRQLPLRPIRSEKELDRAIAMIDSLLDRDRLSPAEQDYLDVLGDLVERYEDQAYPIPDVSDGDMLRFLIDQREIAQAEIARATGIRESRISEVLSGKRKLTRTQITRLAAYFRVSPAVFLSNDALAPRGGKNGSKGGFG
jgi:HTH-type transcriptional regulator / antitoxin HigA